VQATLRRADPLHKGPEAEDDDPEPHLYEERLTVLVGNNPLMPLKTLLARNGLGFGCHASASPAARTSSGGMTRLCPRSVHAPI
jgi:hypothetical protein